MNEKITMHIETSLRKIQSEKNFELINEIIVIYFIKNKNILLCHVKGASKEKKQLMTSSTIINCHQMSLNYYIQP